MRFGQAAILAIVSGHALAVHAAPDIAFTPIAITGDASPLSRTYTSLQPPVLNESGNVAFHGTDSNGIAVWFSELQGSVYTTSVAIDRGDSIEPVEVEPTDVNYSGNSIVSGAYFAAPILSNSDHIAVLSRYSGLPAWTDGNDSGTVPSSSSALQALLRIDAGAATPSLECFAMTNLLIRTDPGGGGSPPGGDEGTGKNAVYYLSRAAELLSRSPQIALTRNESGISTLAFYLKGTRTSGPAQAGGIWWAPSPAMWGTVIREGDFIGGYEIGEVPVDFENAFSMHTISNHHDTAFAVQSIDTGQPDAWHIARKHAADPGVLLAREGVTDAPGVPNNAKFDNLHFAPVVNDNAHVAFRAQTDDTSKWGIWAERDVSGSSVLQNVVYAGDAVPGAAGGVDDEFTKFGDPVINATDHVAFVGEYQDTVTSVVRRGLFLADASGAVSDLAYEGMVAPVRPGTSTSLGTIDSEFADPSINDTENVVFRATVDITESTLSSRLTDVVNAGTNPGLVTEEAIFATDHNGDLFTVVASGMTMAELGGDASDNRVVISTTYVDSDSDDISIDESLTDEGNGSGHQDGRRVGMTNTVTEIVTVEGVSTTYKRYKMGFRVRLSDLDNFGALSYANIVAEASEALCPADLTGDGQVDGADLSVLLASWGACSGCPADLDGDGQVDGADLSILLAAWGACP
ncbi:MAG: choice-of-anchor tandem repeat NxxGxxAF-containing protein [Phycisphaerales bacterium JB043]